VKVPKYGRFLSFDVIYVTLVISIFCHYSVRRHAVHLFLVLYNLFFIS